MGRRDLCESRHLVSFAFVPTITLSAAVPVKVRATQGEKALDCSKGVVVGLK